MPLHFLEDSPHFRQSVLAVEENVKNLQICADRCCKASVKYCQTGQKHVDAGASVVHELDGVGAMQREFALGEGTAPVFEQICSAMREVHDLQRSCFSNSERLAAQALQGRGDEDSRRVKEAKKRFATCDEDWDAALRRSHALRSESAKVGEVDRDFVATKLAFEASRFELVAALNETESAKQISLLEVVSASISDHVTFFEEALDRLRLLHSIQGKMQGLINLQREQLRQDQKQNEATRAHLSHLSEAHQKGELAMRPVGAIAEDDGPPAKEGYLYKKSNSKGPKLQTASWKRLFFRLDGGQLYYYKKGGADGPIERAINLLICTIAVREKETGKRFCFDVVSPYRTYTLQAESEAALTEWVEALRAAVEHNIYSLVEPSQQKARGPGVSAAASTERDAGSCEQLDGSGAPRPNSLVATLTSVPENSACADCGDGATPPTWAVLPFGSLVCIQCSGIHRSLGTHISKVRSISLDSWTPEMAALMARLGNAASKQVLEELLPADERPSPESTRAVKEQWIRRKYVQREFVKRSEDALELSSALRSTSAMGDPRAMLPLIARASSLDSVDHTGRTALHAASAADASLCSELLLLAGASLDIRSADGRTPLHTAAAAGTTRCVEVLVRRGADVNAKDDAGDTPAMLARKAGHTSCEEALADFSDPYDPDKASEQAGPTGLRRAAQSVSGGISVPKLTNIPSNGVPVDFDGSESAQHAETSQQRRDRNRLSRIKRGLSSSIVTGRGKSDRGGVMPQAPSAPVTPRDQRDQGSSFRQTGPLSGASAPNTPRDARGVLARGSAISATPLAGAAVLSPRDMPQTATPRTTPRAPET